MKESFDIVWNKICKNGGNNFFTIKREAFTYKIEDNCFIPLRPKKAPRVSKEYVELAYEQWPVKGPGAFSENILAPSYLWGVFNDNRIINTEEKL